MFEASNLGWNCVIDKANQRAANMKISFLLYIWSGYACLVVEITFRGKLTCRIWKLSEPVGKAACHSSSDRVSVWAKYCSKQAFNTWTLFDWMRQSNGVAERDERKNKKKKPARRRLPIGEPSRSMSPMFNGCELFSISWKNWCQILKKSMKKLHHNFMRIYFRLFRRCVTPYFRLGALQEIN